MLPPRKAAAPAGSGVGCKGALVLLLGFVCLATGILTGRFYEQNLRRGEDGGSAPTSTSSPVLFSTRLKTPPPMCTNTCSKANNGVCDDGRTNSTFINITGNDWVYCDLGTDCEDCGTWTPTGPVSWASGKKKGPIALLLAKGIEVRIKRTSTPISFMFAYTDPVKDVDVSSHVQFGGVLEPGISQIFYSIFKGRCVKGDGKRALFVDVGANFGWYSSLAAVMGCRVLAFEPVPHFYAFLEYNVHVNGLAPLVDMRTNVISHESGKEMQMVVPDQGIWGTAGINGMNIDKAIKSNIEKFMVMSYRVEDLVKEDVILMKIDVEGWEWSVMKGAMKMLEQYNVENIVMEYSPGVPERSSNFEQCIATVQMLVDILDAGFRIAHIDYRIEHKFLLRDRDNKLFTWDVLHPAMEEVTAENLKYDLEDAKRFKDGVLGFPLAEELKPLWHGWGAIPEDLSPRSFRSLLGHNTNIWASKNQAIQQLEGKIGVLKLEDPPNKYFITNKDNFGSGNRPCNHLPPDVQVRHRCPCTNKVVCGEAEKLVTRMAAEGKISSNYVLP